MTTKSPTYRPDIQGVRALAVGIVVVYHIWPAALPGGYVGVDVFFVISGFLITGLLARGVQRTGRVRLLEFYGRRARRLMPASALVLAVTWLVSRAVLPVSQLPAAAEQVRASALYVQNIVLARDAVDYLQAEQAPSPVQHFWSLSVEEQFYLVWPLIFVLAAAAAWVAGRRRNRGGTHRVGAQERAPWHLPAFALGTAVVATSFWYSVRQTGSNPASAYYVTPTRIWELGVGGLLALLPMRVSRPLGRAGALAWLGVAAIVFSALRYSGATLFPGFAAVVPVVGAVALLACGAPQARFGPAVLTSARPCVFLGGISYSLYLWHWPVLVLYKAYVGHGLSVTQGVGVVGASVLLAWLTKQFVEDPVREARFVTRSSLRSLATVGLAAVPVLLASVWLSSQSGPKPHIEAQHVDLQHPGAASVATGTQAPAGVSFIPALEAASRDFPLGTTSKCETDRVRSSVQTCVLGDTAHPTKTVALVGDSHAGQWSDALNVIAKHQHWKLVVATKYACPWTTVQTAVVGQKKPYASCTAWGKALLSELLTTIKPDVVITSDRPYNAVLPDTTASATSLTSIGQGMATYWQTLVANGIGVVGITETPQLDHRAPDCLAARGNTVASCSRAASAALVRTSPVEVAAQEVGGPTQVVDLTDLICPGTACLPAIGNVIVYFDTQHLTRSYTLTLAPFLSTRLLATAAFKHVAS